MGWIKISEKMPPENELVILTSKNEDGSTTTDIAKWCGEKLGWLILLPGLHTSSLSDDFIRYKITHWMPYPAPAED